MVYECDECCAALPADVTACPRCNESFDEPVPPDATLPPRGFTAVGAPSTIILGRPQTPAALPPQTHRQDVNLPDAPAWATPPFAAPSPPPAPREVILLQDADVTVTLTRAVVGGQTFALADITSVSLATIPPDRRGGYIAAMLGAISLALGALLVSTVGVTAGVALLVLAWGILAQKRTKHLVRVGTAAAQWDALWSHDLAHARRIVEAINRAITLRG
jgi:hypothetical protein